MQSRTMFVVKDVEASARWYAQLLDAQTPHGGKYFEMIMKDENVLLFLHHSDPQEHPAIVAPGEGSAGAGVLVYFEVDNPDAVFACAQTLGAELLDEPHINDLAHQYEFSVRDPDGYALTIYRRATAEELAGADSSESWQS
ncbi:MAG: catechol 2,3-dioxygenase-like lactoylglutathione lyase family enzyme [Myxococcota bacterium]|jgi:catechol 2,3-dioxygenase-like lactoylglutathione lyase family enzyme